MKSPFAHFTAYCRDLWVGLNTKLTWVDLLAIGVIAVIDFTVGIPPMLWIPVLLLVYLSGR